MKNIDLLKDNWCVYQAKPFEIPKVIAFLNKNFPVIHGNGASMYYGVKNNVVAMSGFLFGTELTYTEFLELKNAMENKIEKPEPFTIKSDNKLLLQAFAEDAKKLGYTCVGPSGWLYDNCFALISNCSHKYVKLGEYKQICPIKPTFGKTPDLTFNLPADYEKALVYLKSALESEYWEENKKVVYNIGDWVVPLKESGKGNYRISFHNRNTNQAYRIFKIDRIYTENKYVVTENEKGIRDCAGAIVFEEIRKATDAEIEKAIQLKSTKTCYIGGEQFPVYVSKGSIIAEDVNIKIGSVISLISEFNHIHIPDTRWNISRDTISIGCCKNINREQIQNIIDTYNELNK